VGIGTHHGASEDGDELARRRAAAPTGRGAAGADEAAGAAETARAGEAEEEAGAVLTIDCGTCELRHTSACGDCLVSFVCDRPVGGAVVMHAAEARAVRLLGTGGLVPQLRHRRRTG
jgi:hypothetical protein